MATQEVGSIETDITLIRSTSVIIGIIFYLFLLTIGDFVANTQSLQIQLQMYYIIAIFIFGAAMYFEFTLKKELQEFMIQKIQGLLPIFFTSGLLFGIFLQFSSAIIEYFQFLGLSLFLLDSFVLVKSIVIFLHLLISVLLSSIFTYILVRLKSLDNNLKEIPYINHPYGLLILINYIFIGSFITLPVFTLFDFSPFEELSLNASLTTVSFLTPLITMITIISSMFVSVYYFHKIVTQKGIIIDNKKPIIRFGFALLAITIVMFILNYLLYQTAKTSTNGSDSLEIGFLMLVIIALFIPYGVLLLIRGRVSNNSDYCSQCGMIKSNNQCIYCVEAKTIDVGEHKNLDHPICPNCDQKWDELNRQCNNCEYSILLSCSNCMQTLNPLWKECNRCQQKQTPIPELAFEESNNRIKGIKQMKIGYLAVLGIILFIISAIYSYNVYISELSNVQFQQASRTIVNQIIISLLLIISSLWCLHQSRGKYETLWLVLTSIIFLPNIILIVDVLLYLILIFIQLTSFLFEIGLLIPYFIIVFLIGILGYYTRYMILNILEESDIIVKLQQGVWQ